MRSAGLTILLVVAAFVVGALLMNYVVMPIVIHQRRSIIVPDIRGMSENQAMNSVERVSLNFRVERADYSSDVPEGYVISQRPRPNDTLKEGRTVNAVLSLGPRTQRVPELRGLSLRQGRLMLTRQKLRIGRVARVLLENASRETVVTCSPGPGRELKEGGVVNVLVSVGGKRKSYLMPDLDGQDLLFVKDKLEMSGFRVSSVRYESRPGVYPNTIIGQSPAAGALIKEGDSIELVAAGTN